MDAGPVSSPVLTAVRALDMHLQQRRGVVHVAAWIVSLIGYALLAQALGSAISANGGQAYDASSYWLAGRHAFAGEPLYAAVGIGDPGAYRYPPTFAYLIAPLTAVPELVFAWLMRLCSVVALRYLMGSWLWVGWALLFPPVILELLAVNLTLPLAALARWALRDGQLSAALTPFGATLKYGSVLLLPFMWVRRPRLRRSMLIGGASLSIVTAINYLIDPSVWHAFIASLLQQAGSVNDAPFVGDQLLFIFPSTLWDFMARLSIAGALTGVAIWRRWDWLVFVATLVAVPTLWLARLAPLVAVPRLFAEDRRRAP